MTEKKGLWDAVEHIECACSSPEHDYKFTLDLDDDLPSEQRFPSIYVTTFMATGGFFWRLKRAVQYLFGYRCRYGHFDEAIIDSAEDAARLRDLCDRFIAAKAASDPQVPESEL
jgi:hypothetical protein